MIEREIFETLFKTAKASKDPRGTVASCLVQNDTILLCVASADDGIRHSEDLLLEKIKESGITITNDQIIYCTLEPCVKRSRPEMKDCTTLLIESGIKNIVYGARDPEHSEIARQCFSDARILLKQTEDKEIIKECASIYNESVDTTTAPDITLKPLD